jgi:hypothetical protein
MPARGSGAYGGLPRSDHRAKRSACIGLHRSGGGDRRAELGKTLGAWGLSAPLAPFDLFSVGRLSVWPRYSRTFGGVPRAGVS